MNKEQAKELLSFHSTRNEDVHNPKWEHGFLGSLRPFHGELREENLFEVMECLRALKDDFVAPTLEQGVVNDIVAIVHLTRVWASPYGMLGRNNLLTEGQAKRLFAWADIIETCFMFLLDDDPEEAFAVYKDYMDGEYPFDCVNE